MNTYKKHLDQYFEKLIYFRHISGRINKVFQEDIKKYTDEKAIIHFASALNISDWTGPTDNGWEINFPTGIITETIKENYETDLNKIASKQLCLLYSQSFEAFERYLKDCLFDRVNRDEKIREYAISQLFKNPYTTITRSNMPGGNKLFKVLKKAGGVSFKSSSINNNLNIRFGELWNILSEVRHSITHNESLIDIGLINKSNHHASIFNFLFNSKPKSDDTLSVELDYKKFELLIKRFSEFGFQVYKILSIEEGLEWDIKKTTYNK